MALTGVVLCGGQSIRMGTDKGLIPYLGRTWSEVAAGKMAALHLPVAISINPAQLIRYATVFPDTELIVDDPLPALGGPLLALLTVHRRKPAEDLLVLACDMPLIEPAHLRVLVDAYRLRRSFDAYVYTDNESPQPMCGLYTARGISFLFDAYHTGSLKRYSMKAAIAQIKTFPVLIAEAERQFFQNVNLPSDLEGLTSPPGQIPS